jgi:hypothetical protein
MSRWAMASLIVALLLGFALPASVRGSNFTSSASNLAASGTQVGTIKMYFGGAYLTCKKNTYAGKTPGTSFSSLTLTPSFAECTYAGFIGAVVTGFGPSECDFLFNADGHLDLLCPQGKNPVIDAGSCVVSIAPAYNLGSVRYTNASWDHLLVDIEVTGIRYQVHKGFACPASGVSTEVRTDGEYMGEMTLKAGEAQLRWDG